MADEIKPETTPEEPVDAPEPVEPAEQAEEAEEGAKDEPSQIDYRAELALEKARSEKLQREIADRDFKLREARRKQEEEGEIPEDAPLTEGRLKDILATERQATQKEVQSVQIRDIAGKLASTPEEAALIVEIHKNRQFPESLSLQEQLEEAHAIANRKKFASRNSELARALRSKDTALHDTASTYRDVPAAAEPKIAQADVQAMKEAGMSWDGKQRLYSKKLPSGKFLYFDPKTKKRFTR